MAAPSPEVAAWQETDARQTARGGRSPALPFESRTPPGGAERMVAAGVAPMRAPERPASPQDIARLGSEPISEPGARPLIEDDKLGWTTGIKPLLQQREGAGVRLGTQSPESFKIRSNRGWIVLIVLMLAGLAAGVGIAMHEEGDTSSARP